MEKVGIYGLYIYIVIFAQEGTFSVVAHSSSTTSFHIHFTLSGFSRFVRNLFDLFSYSLYSLPLPPP